MQEMMTNVDFYVTPVLNIDGYVYTWKSNEVSAFHPMDIYQIAFSRVLS